MNLTKHTRDIDPDVLDVLRDGAKIDIDNRSVTLFRQLDRKLYEKTNKILANYGGRWNRKSATHLFSLDDIAKLKGAVEAGRYVDEKKAYQFFPTPMSLAREMVEAAHVCAGDRVLEPSAGLGAIALAAFDREAVVDCVEIHEERAKKLNEEGFRTVCCDFLELEPEEVPVYDAILMNPPFSNLADVDHVTHGLKFLKPGGYLVAIMSPAYTFHETVKAAAFRELIEHPTHHRLCYVSDDSLPEGTFKESGTNIATRMLVFRKDS